MVEKRFWKPTVTSTFTICPIPLKLDTYKGCIYNCKYCFARDNTIFHRRKTEHDFTYLEGNDSDKLRKYLNKVFNNEYNYKNATDVAIKERIPMKIGVMADPFPYVEQKEHITYDILKVLEKYKYPIQISTKNPSILANICEDFNAPNWVVAVTIISTDDKFVKIVEPNAPSVQERLEGIKNLTSKGVKVIVRIQPCIYPKIMNELEELIIKVKKSGCFGFVMEGLKVRKAMCLSEQKLFSELSIALGYDVRSWYKENGTNISSDWDLTKEQKMEYINYAQELANEHNLKCFIGDNNIGKVGCNGECCGTEVLNNYKLANCSRNQYFGDYKNYSNEFGKCKVNFCRSKTYNDMTIDEAINHYKNIIK